MTPVDDAFFSDTAQAVLDHSAINIFPVPQPPIKKNMTMIYHTANGWFRYYNFGIKVKNKKFVSSKSKALWRIKQNRFGGMQTGMYNRHGNVLFEELLNK